MTDYKKNQAVEATGYRRLTADVRHNQKNNPMKNKLIISIILIIIFIVGLLIYYKGRQYELIISEQQFIDKINEKCPLTKNYLILFDITLRNPRIDLINGSNRINAGMNVDINFTISSNKKIISGSVDFSGNLKYENENGEFFLQYLTIDKVEIDGIPEKYIEKTNAALKNALQFYYNKHPVYRLNDNDIKQVVAKALIKSITINDEKVIVILGL